MKSGSVSGLQIRILDPDQILIGRGIQSLTAFVTVVMNVDSKLSSDSHQAEFPQQVQEHQTPAALLLLLLLMMMIWAVIVN